MHSPAEILYNQAQTDYLLPEQDDSPPQEENAMDQDSRTDSQQQPPSPPPAPEEYEAPRIETVLTPEELEREMQYAGVIVTPPLG